jgi:hypothetical protein
MVVVMRMAVVFLMLMVLEMPGMGTGVNDPGIRRR